MGFARGLRIAACVVFQEVFDVMDHLLNSEEMRVHPLVLC